MKYGIASKLLLPIAAFISLCAVVAGVLIVGMVRDALESRANEQTTGRVESVRQELEAVNELSLDKVHASMKLLLQGGTQLGDPSTGAPASIGSEQVPSLFLGRSDQVNNYKLVDQTTLLMGGTATLFVRRDDDYVRVSTNVKKQDGTRAVGTRLDPSGKAYASIRAGEPFYGVVDILGSPYMTGYEPMRNRKGETVGIWYVGYPLSALNQLGETIAESRILEGGFLAIVDNRGKVLFKSKHVSTDEVTRVLRQGGNSESESWDVLSRPFDAWGYVVTAAHPEKDISREVTRTTIVVIGCTIVAALLLLSSIAVLVSRVLRRPLRLLIRQMENADLRTELRSERKDEIGDLQVAFDHFVGSLRGTLVQMSEAGAAVASASREISSSTEEMAAGAQEQTSQAGEVASAVEEMTKTIVENSRNASGTAETAKQARAAAEQGGEVVAETVKGMRRIAEVVKRSAQTVQTLGKSSEQIGEIIGVIDEIADQTNLLALNAAIEAARAGEQGRGFAVVADEVRKLAERTTQATKEIAGMIKKIQQDTQGAVSSMQEGTQQVDEGITLADKAGASLEQIVGISQKVTDMVTQIAAASEQQSSSSEQISKNVEAISTVTSESAAGIQQIARAAEDLNRLTGNMETLLERFNLSSEAEESRPEPEPAPVYELPKSDLAVRANGRLVKS